MSARRWWSTTLIGALAGGLSLTGGLALPSVAEAAPPGMPDPSTMSGIPRPDPNLAPGTITVRCLDGSFANPVLGTEVTLTLQPPGAEPVVLKATTVEQGRATFTVAADQLGLTAKVAATVAGQPLSSQAFVIGPKAGVALLLVATGNGQGGQGGGQGPAVHGGGPVDAHGGGQDPHGGGQDANAHGGQGAVPVPGKPFPLDGRPRGTLIVGALDLGRDDQGGETGAGLGPIADIEVKLIATVPGVAEPIVETLTTDSEGRASFEQLDVRLPEGAAIVVEAVLADGEEPTRSHSFTLGETAYAVILARGTMPAQAPQQAPQHGSQQAGPPQRLALPGPRVDKSLKPGQVRVFVVDANDRPVADQLVVVHSSESSGGSGNVSGKTDAQGMVILDEVPGSADVLSQVRVVYAGAPYSSTLFEMPSDAGALVLLRVFEPTADRNRVRSALQIDVNPQENDFASVSFNYAVFVEGDQAFYVPGGVRMFGPVGTRSLKVFKEAEGYLLHDGETPWVDLDRPLEPGVELRLSFAVGLAHDGSLELDWSTPFPLVDKASVVVVPDRLSVSKGVAGAPELDPHAGRDGEGIKIYALGHERFEPGLCDLLVTRGYACPTQHWAGNDLSIIIEDLPIRRRIWWVLGWSLLGLTTLGVSLGMLVRRRVSPRQALLTRRDALMAELLALDAAGVDSPEARKTRARMLRALDRIYRQLEVV